MRNHVERAHEWYTHTMPWRLLRSLTLAAFVPILLSQLPGYSPTVLAQGEKGSDIDVEDYKIQAELVPAQHLLTAKTQVQIKALHDTQSVVLEMNGSLAVSKVSFPDGKALQFIQDKLDALNVRVDLGKLVASGTVFTLAFEYSGQLATPAGGVLQDKRLAYVGDEGSYLTYAARWFPFHDYFADRATSTIELTVPKGLVVAGMSDQAVLPREVKGGKNVFTFVSATPTLPGTFAIGTYIQRSIKSKDVEIDFFLKPGNESVAEPYAEILAKVFDLYQARFGTYAFGERFQVAQIDNESLSSFSMAGVTLLAESVLDPKKEAPEELLARAAGLQWWGQAVGLKSFDDAWLSQGLAEYSSFLFRQSTTTPAKFQEVGRETLERALAFEAQTSIRRAPAELDDQSVAYASIVLYKGALVYNMIRNVLGDDKFFSLLQRFYAGYRGKKAGIEDLESLTSKIAGQDMRYFFGLWVDSTGVPEFRSDYSIIRTRSGTFKVRGTLRQDLDAFRMSVDLELDSEGGTDRTTVNMNGTAVDFEISSKGMPTGIAVDPDYKIMHSSEDIRVAVIVRRGIQNFKDEHFVEAEDDFKSAIKLNSRSSWAHYNLGLLYMQQRNYPKAIDAFSDAIDGDGIPSWLAVWSHVKKGNSYDALGQRERAVAEYNKAVASGNDYDSAQAAAQQFLGKPYTRPRD